MISATQPLKAGEILVPDENSAWFERWKQVKTVSSHTFSGVEYWWVEMTPKNGATHLDTMGINTLRASWKRKPTFYRIGKRYRFPSGRTDVWLILEIYDVSSFYGNNTRVKAVARRIQTDGHQDIETLSENDFARMVEV